MHYEKYESNKTPYIIYLPFKLLQQSVFGIVHVLWDILWTSGKYRDTDVDDQWYDRRWYCSLKDSSIGENIKRTTDAYKLMYTHTNKRLSCILMMYLHYIAVDLP